MGNLAVASGARIEHDAVAVGGMQEVADGATVLGQKVNVSLPFGFPKLKWLGSYWTHCIKMLRPLAPQVGWVWVVYGVFFLAMLFVAAVLPRPVQACVDGLTRRPATTFLMGLLMILFVPVMFLILLFTGVGLIVMPFLAAALFLAAFVGKVAIREWLGIQIGRHFGAGFQKPVVSFLIGSILITVLYIVPILGLLTYGIVCAWGLGCTITAAFSRPGSPSQSQTPRPGS